MQMCVGKACCKPLPAHAEDPAHSWEMQFHARG